MASNNVPTSGKLVSAAGGNQQLLEVLRQITANMQLQQTVTSTSGKNVPPQATGAVSFLQGNYIVQITNPGAVPALSALQSAQQTQGQTSQSNTAPITTIYHQVQAAGSPRFDIAANVQTFGGNTGSAQTFWTLTNLGSGNFYFRFRSSYDGVNFNQWKNANGGQSITSRPSSVTVETVQNGVFGVFQLAGGQLVAVGAGLSSDGGTFTLPDYLYSSAMQNIAGPNGFTDKGHTVSTVSVCDVGIAVPADPAPLTGPADYPVVVNMEYEDNGGNINPGIANWFTFAFDPLGPNVTLQEYSSGNWAIFQMPGGWQLAVGSGTVASGAAFTLPPGFNSANMLSIPTPNGYVASGHQAAGILNGSITGNVLTMEYGDNSSNTWTAPGSWFAIAWSPGVSAVTTSGGKWLVFTAPSGSQIAFGAGTIASGASFALPTGFTSANMLTFATPATTTLSGNVMHGVESCFIKGTTATLVYQDGSGNTWSGNVNWFAFAWAAPVPFVPPPPPVVAPPTGLSAVAISASQIDLSWTASTTSGVTYSVFRSLTSGFTPGGGNQIASGLSSTSYNDTGLAASTPYYYIVEAVNMSGNAPSAQATATTLAVTVNPPTGLTAVETSSSQISLSWTASTTTGVTYSVFRSLTSGFTPGSGNRIAFGLSGVTYADSGLASSTTYYYLVEAVESGVSAVSNQASATTGTAINPPTGLTAAPASSTQVNLAWTASTTGGVTYSVFRSSTSGFTPGSGNQIASGLAGIAYSDTGLSATTVYYYLVEAVLSGLSATSNQATATTAGNPQPSPGTTTAATLSVSATPVANAALLTGATASLSGEKASWYPGFISTSNAAAVALYNLLANGWIGRVGGFTSDQMAYRTGSADIAVETAGRWLCQVGDIAIARIAAFFAATNGKCLWGVNVNGGIVNGGTQGDPVIGGGSSVAGSNVTTISGTTITCPNKVGYATGSIVVFWRCAGNLLKNYNGAQVTVTNIGGGQMTFTDTMGLSGTNGTDPFNAAAYNACTGLSVSGSNVIVNQATGDIVVGMLVTGFNLASTLGHQFNYATNPSQYLVIAKTASTFTIANPYGSLSVSGETGGFFAPYSITTPANTAAEAAAVVSAFGSNLLGIEALGNESDTIQGWNMAGSAFGSGGTYTEADWESVANLFLAAYASGTPKAGCTIGDPSSSWSVSSLNTYAADLIFGEQHYYVPGGTGSGNGISATALLTSYCPDPGLSHFNSALSGSFGAACLAKGLPYGNTEGNLGTAGPAIAQQYCSTFSAITNVLQLALFGGSTWCFQGGDQNPFSAIWWDESTGQITAVNPLFHALVFIGMMVGPNGSGTLIENTPSVSGLNVQCYSAKVAANQINVMVVNMDGANNLDLVLTAPWNLANASALVMNQSANNLTATTGVEIQGSSISTAGAFTPGAAYTPPGAISGATVPFYVGLYSSLLVSLYALPTITSISPTSVAHGGASFTLTVDSTDGRFVSGATVKVNGTPVTTIFISATEVQATVPSTAITSAGTLSITVTNPSPGAGTSNAETLTVT